MKIYGLPYTGSKDKIADKICSLFPIKENFYDLFGGGGSITHYQLLQNNYKHYIYNEYNPLVAKTFKMAINGEFKNESRWISHGDFNRLKDTDPYVACCFSFGNDFQSYAYGKDVEPYKKALHYAIVFQDYKLMNELFPDVDFTFLDKINNVTDRRLKLQNFMKKNGIGKNTSIESSVNNMTISQNNNHLESLNSISDFRIENLERFEKINNLNISRTEIEHLERYNKLQSLNQLESVKRLETVKRLEIFNKSYDEIEIKPNSIIYLDPPYKSTKKYVSSKDFDYEKFYDWCSKQTELCFISEYEMPSDRFTCIAEIEHRSIICATENQKVVEKVFLPNHQVKDYKMPSIFDL